MFTFRTGRSEVRLIYKTTDLELAKILMFYLILIEYV